MQPPSYWISISVPGNSRSGYGTDAALCYLGLSLYHRGKSRRRISASRHRNGSTIPAYRTLKELYLLASEWLLGAEAEVGPVTPAERQGLNFHLRQFVDAASPALSCASNPVALRRALETGVASLADGWRNLIGDVQRGKLTMVDATAFQPGRNLAVSAGKVVYRNKLIELSSTNRK